MGRKAQRVFPLCSCKNAITMKPASTAYVCSARNCNFTASSLSAVKRHKEVAHHRRLTAEDGAISVSLPVALGLRASRVHLGQKANDGWTVDALTGANIKPQRKRRLEERKVIKPRLNGLWKKPKLKPEVIEEALKVLRSLPGMNVRHSSEPPLKRIKLKKWTGLTITPAEDYDEEELDDDEYLGKEEEEEPMRENKPCRDALSCTFPGCLLDVSDYQALLEHERSQHFAWAAAAEDGGAPCPDCGLVFGNANDAILHYKVRDNKYISSTHSQ